MVGIIKVCLIDEGKLEIKFLRDPINFQICPNQYYARFSKIVLFLRAVSLEPIVIWQSKLQIWNLGVEEVMLEALFAQFGQGTVFLHFH